MENKDLKAFYDTQWLETYGIPYEMLSEEAKTSAMKSISFSIWKFKRSWNFFKSALRRALNK